MPMKNGLTPAAWFDASIAPPPPWSGADAQALHCVQIIKESADVKTFVLAAPGRHFRYLPGQFLTLELQIDGQAVNRCYTLSSSPTRPHLAAITVKRVTGGLVSNWLHDHMQAGSALQALGPAGEFSCFTRPAVNYLVLAGGSGITPLMSMLRALHDLGADADVVLVQCARTPDDLLFRDELVLMAQRMPRWRLAWLCDGPGTRAGWTGPLGRLDAAMLARIAPDVLTRDIYTCGPAPFMASVREMLGQMRADMGRYREESFAFAAPAVVDPPQQAPADAKAARYAVTLQKSGRRFECSGEQTLLQAALEAGVRLPHSCSSGACGTCKTQKLSGEVEMKHGGGIRPREVVQGWVLPCCSRPLGDVVLDR